MQPGARTQPIGGNIPDLGRIHPPTYPPRISSIPTPDGVPSNINNRPTPERAAPPSGETRGIGGMFESTWNNVGKLQNRIGETKQKYQAKLADLDQRTKGAQQQLAIGSLQLAASYTADKLMDLPIKKVGNKVQDNVNTWKIDYKKTPPKGLQQGDPSKGATFYGGLPQKKYPEGPINSLKAWAAEIPKGHTRSNITEGVETFLEDWTDKKTAQFLGNAITHPYALPSQSDHTMSSMATWGLKIAQRKFAQDDPELQTKLKKLNDVISPLTFRGTRNILEASGRMALEVIPGVSEDMRAKYRIPVVRGTIQNPKQIMNSIRER